jgi:hypothetical protein
VQDITCPSHGALLRGLIEVAHESRKDPHIDNPRVAFIATSMCEFSFLMQHASDLD